MNKLPKVQVKMSKEYHTCDCCGGYTIEAGYIVINGEEKEYISHETHFGEGNWDGEDESLFPMILKLLGYELSYRANYLYEEKDLIDVTIDNYASPKEDQSLKENEIVFNLTYESTSSDKIVDALIEMDGEEYIYDHLGWDALEIIFNEIASKVCTVTITRKK